MTLSVLYLLSEGMGNSHFAFKNTSSHMKQKNHWMRSKILLSYCIQAHWNMNAFIQVLNYEISSHINTIIK